MNINMIGLISNNIIGFMYIITNINNKKCFFKPKIIRNWGTLDTIKKKLKFKM